MATTDAGWYGADSGVSQTRGRLFEALCLAASSIGLLSVFVLLLYVANDAFKPLSADPGWHLVFLATVGLPAIALAAYYYFRADRLAGEVAYTTTGLPIVGLLLAGGLGVVFAELLSIKEFFALVIGVAAVVALVVGHTRLRPTAALERLVLTLLLSVVVLLGRRRLRSPESPASQRDSSAFPSYSSSPRTSRCRRYNCFRRSRCPSWHWQAGSWADAAKADVMGCSR